MATKTKVTVNDVPRFVMECESESDLRSINRLAVYRLDVFMRRKAAELTPGQWAKFTPRKRAYYGAQIIGQVVKVNRTTITLRNCRFGGRSFGFCPSEWRVHPSFLTPVEAPTPTR